MLIRCRRWCDLCALARPIFEQFQYQGLPSVCCSCRPEGVAAGRPLRAGCASVHRGACGERANLGACNGEGEHVTIAKRSRDQLSAKLGRRETSTSDVGDPHVGRAPARVGPPARSPRQQRAARRPFSSTSRRAHGRRALRRLGALAVGCPRSDRDQPCTHREPEEVVAAMLARKTKDLLMHTAICRFCSGTSRRPCGEGSRVRW